MCNEISVREMYHVLHDNMIVIVEENSSFALSAWVVALFPEGLCNAMAGGLPCRKVASVSRDQQCSVFLHNKDGQKSSEKVDKWKMVKAKTTFLRKTSKIVKKSIRT